MVSFELRLNDSALRRLWPVISSCHGATRCLLEPGLQQVYLLTVHAMHAQVTVDTPMSTRLHMLGADHAKVRLMQAPPPRVNKTIISHRCHRSPFLSSRLELNTPTYEIQFWRPEDMHQNNESNRLLDGDIARAGPPSPMEIMLPDTCCARGPYPKAEPIARLRILANIGGLLRWCFSCVVTGTSAAVSARAAGESILPIPAYITACVSWNQPSTVGPGLSA